MRNIYSQPEAFGLRQFAMVDDANANYSFNRVVVWYDPVTLEYFWAQDAGCSCPSPFENVTSRDQLIRLYAFHSSLRGVLAAAVMCGASLDDRLSFERALESRPRR